MDEQKKVISDQDVYYLRQSKNSLLINIVGIQLLFILLAIIIIWTLMLILNFLLLSGGILVLIVLGVLLLIDAFITISTLVNWRTTVYAIRENELIVQRGLIEKREKLHALNQVETVTVRQGPLGRHFNYGTLVIYSPLLQDRVFLYNVPDPRKYEKLLVKVPPEEAKDKGLIVDHDPDINTV